MLACDDLGRLPADSFKIILEHIKIILLHLIHLSHPNILKGMRFKNINIHSSFLLSTDNKFLDPQ